MESFDHLWMLALHLWSKVLCPNRRDKPIFGMESWSSIHFGWLWFWSILEMKEFSICHVFYSPPFFVEFDWYLIYFNNIFDINLDVSGDRTRNEFMLISFSLRSDRMLLSNYISRIIVCYIKATSSLTALKTYDCSLSDFFIHINKKPRIRHFDCPSLISIHMFSVTLSKHGECIHNALKYWSHLKIIWKIDVKLITHFKHSVQKENIIRWLMLVPKSFLIHVLRCVYTRKKEFTKWSWFFARSLAIHVKESHVLWCSDHYKYISVNFHSLWKYIN